VVARDSWVTEISAAAAAEEKEFKKMLVLVEKMRAPGGLEIGDHYGARSGLPWEKEARYTIPFS
jgi:hypothetical protein